MIRIPYARPAVDAEDLAAVRRVLASSWLTTGPEVERFETAVAAVAGVAHGVAVSSGTAALHAAVAALDIGPGDEVLVPAITFAATANAVVYQGATPVFCDVDPATLLVDPEDAARRVTPRTRALIAVDYAGQAADYEALRAVTDRHGLALIADASHALGAHWRGRPVGSLADLTTFSFHPVKPITTGEGGMVVTADAGLAQRLRRFRNHGITQDARARADAGTWEYDQAELGWNYRLSDLQCALGRQQLRKARRWRARRQAIAARYTAGLRAIAGVEPLACRDPEEHAWHLYVVRVAEAATGRDRRALFEALRHRGYGVNVHYRPVYLHTFYKRRFAVPAGTCPQAEAAYAQILSLPMFPGLPDAVVDDVLAIVGAATGVP